ncbi:hypothetical protein QBC47DRAFT_415995 [Echria macrotheca]|uniref:Uncharacterized protein n=1 Tax=Echria macrotheca TaxID=438768 RepID=A0AAJ0B7X4_9PEZI|nr:hypothetical protein QBC47DRAFT_415995 [Echria macrotheca]
MVQPTTYTLTGDSIHATSSAPLYQISHDLDALTHTVSSITFSRITYSSQQEPDSDHDHDHVPPRRLSPLPAAHEHEHPERAQTPDKLSVRHEARHNKLFTLVHPANARYRTDIPAAFYMTAAPGMGCLGNVRLVDSASAKGRLRLGERGMVRAVVCPGFTAASVPLFSEEAMGEGEGKVLFTVRPAAGMGMGMGLRRGRGRGQGRWEWIWGDGKEVVAREERGREEEEGGRKWCGARLVVLREMEREEEVDALVAAWVLRMWGDVAEEREFQKEAIMALTPPESVFSYDGMKMNKRVGALGGFAAAGGAC